MGSSLRVKVQKFGRFLSGMVMPNIGAFIAWGLITAFFIPTGWIPNESLAKLVGPMLNYLLPLLIGYTGGKAVWGARGGVVGAIATTGVIVGSTIPMFIGAMFVGPVAAYLMKKFDELVDGHIPVGFEMLVNNFSAGILGMLLALVSFVVINPAVTTATLAIQSGVKVIVDAHLLPLTSIIIEPAKVLFLNNALNHGIFGPLGAAEVQSMGKSIFFLLETNPGPGLGVLLAYFVFAKGNVKNSTPGAIIIHFFGGIHEIYFPYVLMRPVLVLAVVAGGMSSVAVFSLLGAGAVATPSPGSIFALMAMAYPNGGHLPIIAGVVVGTVVSFLVASIFVKRSAAQDDDESLESARQAIKDLKGNTGKISKIVFACDAGMGSSAMGANRLQKKLKAAGLTVKVDHCSVDDIDTDAQIVICQENLVDRVASSLPNVTVFGIKNFVNAPEYDQIVELLLKENK